MRSITFLRWRESRGFSFPIFLRNFLIIIFLVFAFDHPTSRSAGYGRYIVGKSREEEQCKKNEHHAKLHAQGFALIE